MIRFFKRLIGMDPACRWCGGRPVVRDAPFAGDLCRACANVDEFTRRKNLANAEMQAWTELMEDQR